MNKWGCHYHYSHDIIRLRRLSNLRIIVRCFQFHFQYHSLWTKILRRIVSFRLMGRTVPTWRNRVESELTALNAFRRALNSTDRAALDALMNGVRNRRAAGGMLPSIDVWKPMLISMILESYKKISELENLIRELQSEK